MLLPGAGYILILLVGLVGVVACAFLSLFIGSLTLSTSEFLIERTNAYKMHRRGTKDTDRWWFNTRSWAGAFMFGSFIVFIYVFVGPYSTFIKYIGGL